MTIGVAWVGVRSDGREHLYLASDSRVRGGHVLDACPKIFTLPRSDCALCFAGVTVATYPLMMQVAYAIAAHEPARKRNLDIGRVKAHILRVFTDVFGRIKEQEMPLTGNDLQFIFAGYSWLQKQFRIWTIYYQEKEKRFAAREAFSFHPQLSKATFIGDWAKKIRSDLVKDHLKDAEKPAHLEPLMVIARAVEKVSRADTIGGPPQVVRITQHLNTRPLCVRWKGEDTLFGRPLFDYENVDYWIVEPFKGKFSRPRNFGYRNSDEEVDESSVDA